MPERDPQVQAAMDAAVRELARRLEPYVPDVSRYRLAVEFVEWQHARGLRYVPSPPEVTAHGRRDPDVARRGAARARAALEGADPA